MAMTWRRHLTSSKSSENEDMIELCKHIHDEALRARRLVSRLHQNRAGFSGGTEMQPIVEMEAMSGSM